MFNLANVQMNQIKSDFTSDSDNRDIYYFNKYYYFELSFHLRMRNNFHNNIKLQKLIL